MIEGGLELMFDEVEGWVVEYNNVEYRNGMLFEGKNTACWEWVVDCRGQGRVESTNAWRLAVDKVSSHDAFPYRTWKNEIVYFYITTMTVKN